MGIVSAFARVTAPASRTCRASRRSSTDRHAMFSSAGVGGARRDYECIRDHIAAVVTGFEDFNRRISRGTFTPPHAARKGSVRQPTQAANSAPSVHDAQCGRRRAGDDDWQPQTAQHHRLRLAAATRHPGGRRVVFLHRRRRARGTEGRPRSTSASEHHGVRRVARRRGVPTRDRGASGTYFPATNVLVRSKAW